jgi:hypothetical protein
MKKIIITGFAAFLAFSTLAAAEEKAQAPADKGPSVEEVKQQLLQQIDKEMARINQIRAKEDEIMSQFKSCISGIKSEADFKACVVAKDEAAKKFRVEMEKAYLDNQKKAIANEEKRLNDEMKKR